MAAKRIKRMREVVLEEEPSNLKEMAVNSPEVGGNARRMDNAQIGFSTTISTVVEILGGHTEEDARS
jgi:hypothetical protein